MMGYSSHCVVSSIKSDLLVIEIVSKLLSLLLLLLLVNQQ